LWREVDVPNENALELEKLEGWSNRLSLATGLLFVALGVRFAAEAWRCPTSDSLAFAAFMLPFGIANISQFLFAKRDHLALLTWLHTLGFAGLAFVAYREPTSLYVVPAITWGLLSLLGPLIALMRPVPPPARS
jgi:hypothetical protein